MALIYKSYIPKGIGEIMDHLAYMFFSSPAFVDPHFVGRDLPAAFHALNEALGLIRDKFGEEHYAAAIELSNRIRAHFEADPEDKNGEARAGRKLIREMEALLTARPAKA